MKVRRIVANIATADVAAAKRFYQEVLGLGLLMDQGWIATYGSREKAGVQVSIMSEGGSGTPVPDLSIEVDDLDTALARMKAAGVAIEYGPAAPSVAAITQLAEDLLTSAGAPADLGGR